MIPFVENKYFNSSVFEGYISQSNRNNQWSNFGPLCQSLERKLGLMLDVRNDLDVVACNSGTTALWSAMLYYEQMHNRKLKWNMCAFSFPCVPESLFDIDFIDCNQSGMLDLNLIGECDGLIVTNLFGSFNISEYVDYATNNDKILIVDGAMNFNGYTHRQFEMISFHHTKPWGFGEAGCIIVPKDLKQCFYSIINFGRQTDNKKYKQFSCNGKISEVACASLLMWLNQTLHILDAYKHNYQRILASSLELGLQVLGNNQGFPANVPILFPKKVEISNDFVILGKYYEPIKPLPVATDLYERIVNFPCHCGISDLNDKQIREILFKLRTN